MSFLKKIYNTLSSFDANNPLLQWRVASIFLFIVIISLNVVSLMHVYSVWALTNGDEALALAIVTALIVLGGLVGAQYSRLATIVFFLGLFIELHGNVYDAYLNVKVESEAFIAWMDLMLPIFDKTFIPLFDIWEVKLEGVKTYKWILSSVQGSLIPVTTGIIFWIWKIVLNNVPKKPNVEPTGQTAAYTLLPIFVQTTDSSSPTSPSIPQSTPTSYQQEHGSTVENKFFINKDTPQKKILDSELLSASNSGDTDDVGEILPDQEEEDISIEELTELVEEAEDILQEAEVDAQEAEVDAQEAEVDAQEKKN